MFRFGGPGVDGAVMFVPPCSLCVLHGLRTLVNTLHTSSNGVCMFSYHRAMVRKAIRHGYIRHIGIVGKHSRASICGGTRGHALQRSNLPTYMLSCQRAHCRYTPSSDKHVGMQGTHTLSIGGGYASQGMLRRAH